MPVHDELGKRMKEYYEEIPKIKLYRRLPVVIRLDMRCGHSYCRGFRRPFDDLFIKSMQETAKYLCENVMGAVLSYQQSDEISLLLIDYKKLESQAFFDYEVQKICSVTASMATMAFNKIFSRNLIDFHPDVTFYDGEDPSEYDCAAKFGFDVRTPEGLAELRKYCEVYDRAIEKGAIFDSRCFNIPESEVANYFLWRQLDATRNSIQMVGQANFSHKELQGKSCSAIQDMLHEQRGINWNDFSTYKKRGSCCIKVNEEVDGIMRSKWIVGEDIPIFKGDGRNYIEGLL